MTKQKQSNDEIYRDPYTIDWIEQLKGIEDAIEQNDSRTNDFAAVRAIESQENAQAIKRK